MESNSESPIELGYAPPLPWYQTQRFRRIGLGVSLACLIGAILLWAPRIVRGFEMMLLQQRCMKWPQAIQPLLDPINQVAVYDFVNGQQFFRTDPVPQAWRSLYALMSSSQLKSLGTLYLQDRVAPDGKHYLVAVDLVAAHPGPDPREDIVVRVIEPGTAFHAPQIKSISTETLTHNGCKSVHLYFGKTDPYDPTHFKIDFEQDARESKRPEFDKAHPSNPPHFEIDLEPGKWVGRADISLRSDASVRLDQWELDFSRRPPSSAASSH